MFGDNNKGLTSWLADLVNGIGLAWWVKIETKTPPCTYYFGPFLTPMEAEREKDGYIEDLKAEGAEGIEVSVVRCRPEELTIDAEKKTRMPLSVGMTNVI
ncbi:DUF1816 domain-containing protein [uncultured Thermosynechococcus sp.]|uniref:DUF1816 domain-containing protein n=1 Tax=uncultured Thermosynechococcus sp. TaxID=436945 RepID=UPI00260302A7|nr:DUF1816 domain-containing protein [uncultured Thermosynechococcus sp.]